MPDGHPSTMPPMPFPCDSPKDVNVNNLPCMFDILNSISFLFSLSLLYSVTKIQRILNVRKPVCPGRANKTMDITPERDNIHLFLSVRDVD